MSEDDVAVVRANSQAFSDRDVDRMLSYYAPDAEVTDRRAMGLGAFQGHDELRRYYSSIFNSADAMREYLEILAAGDGVVAAHAELWARLAGDTTGAGFTTPYGMVLHLRDGLITLLEVYADGEDALAASGLSGT